MGHRVLFSFLYIAFAVYGTAASPLDVVGEGSSHNDKGLAYLRKIQKDIPIELAKLAAGQLLKRFTEWPMRPSIKGEERVPVLPDLPEPFPLPDLNIGYIPIDFITGTIYTWDSSIVGLSNVTDNLRVLNGAPGSGTIRVIYEIQTKTLATIGQQNISMSFITEKPVEYRSGPGDSDITLENGFVRLEFVLEVNIVTDELHMRNFIIDLDFDKFHISFDDSVLNGEELNWTVISIDITTLLKAVRPVIKEYLEPFIKNTFEGAFKYCDLSDLIQLDFSCVGSTEPVTTTAPGNPETTLGSETTTTAPGNPETTTAAPEEPEITTTAGSVALSFNTIAFILLSLALRVFR